MKRRTLMQILGSIPLLSAIPALVFAKTSVELKTVLRIEVIGADLNKGVVYSARVWSEKCSWVQLRERCDVIINQLAKNPDARIMKIYNDDEMVELWQPFFNCYVDMSKSGDRLSNPIPIDVNLIEIYNTGWVKRWGRW